MGERRPLHFNFFSFLKQVEKRLKLENPSEQFSPLPSPLLESKKLLTESLSSPIYLDLDHFNKNNHQGSSVLQDSSEAPEAFLSCSPQFIPTQENPTHLQDPKTISDSEAEAVDDIEELIQLLGLSSCQGDEEKAGLDLKCGGSKNGGNSCHCEGGFYEKIVGVKGPKCRRKVERLEGWINTRLAGAALLHSPLVPWRYLKLALGPALQEANLIHLRIRGSLLDRILLIGFPLLPDDREVEHDQLFLHHIQYPSNQIFLQGTIDEGFEGGYDEGNDEVNDEGNDEGNADGNNDEGNIDEGNNGGHIDVGIQVEIDPDILDHIQYAANLHQQGNNDEEEGVAINVGPPHCNKAGIVSVLAMSLLCTFSTEDLIDILRPHVIHFAQKAALAVWQRWGAVLTSAAAHTYAPQLTPTVISLFCRLPPSFIALLHGSTPFMPRHHQFTFTLPNPPILICTETPTLIPAHPHHLSIPHPLRPLITSNHIHSSSSELNLHIFKNIGVLDEGMSMDLDLTVAIHVA